MCHDFRVKKQIEAGKMFFFAGYHMYPYVTITVLKVLMALYVPHGE